MFARPLAVQQHQGAVRTQAAQVQPGHAVAGIVCGAPGTGVQLRHLVEVFLECWLTGKLELFSGNGGDWAGRTKITALDARAGDDYLLQQLLVRLGRVCFILGK